ncbi:MAG: HSP20 family protein [Parasphingorhabdus sp.]|jgi:HSP20 family protein
MKLKNLKPWNWFKKEQKNELSDPVQPSKDHFSSNELFGKIRQDMDQIFETRLREFGLQASIRQPIDVALQMLSPSIDIKESRKNYVVSVEMPGVEKDRVNVSIDGNLLTIGGEKIQELKQDDEDYHHIERSFGSFQRMLDLPDNANTDQLDTSFKKGILTLKIGKHKEQASTGRNVDIRDNEVLGI